MVAAISVILSLSRNKSSISDCAQCHYNYLQHLFELIADCVAVTLLHCAATTAAYNRGYCEPANSNMAM
jgi:hypothetical protein